jgi:hypothetical protein
MASFSRKTGIIGALVIAGVLVVGSVLITNKGLSFLSPNSVNAESTQALLQAYAARDSDNDGLPDWEEALYGLDPNNPHSFSPNMTDGEAVAQGLVKPKFLSESASSTADTASSTDALPNAITAAPGSLTEQFSQSLLTQYLNQSSNNGAQMSDADIATFAQNAMQTFAQQHSQQDVYALGQVKTGGTGNSALQKYAVAAEQAITANTVNTSESEISYFSDAIEKNDPTALKQVAAIGAAYTGLAPALMQIQVPQEAQQAHLEIANASARLGGDITDLSTMNSDPLRAYIGLEQYQTDATSLARGFADMSAVYKNNNVTFQQGDAGYNFYSILVASNPDTGTTTP